MPPPLSMPIKIVASASNERQRLRRLATSNEQETPVERDETTTATARRQQPRRRAVTAAPPPPPHAPTAPVAQAPTTHSESPPHLKVGTTLVLMLIFVLLTPLALGSEVVSDAGATTTRFSLCHNEHNFTRRHLESFSREKRRVRDPIGVLFRWCVADAACADAFFISQAGTRDEEVAFRYLSTHWLQLERDEVDLMRPFNETVCEHESFDDMLRLLWVLAMRLGIKEMTHIECSANERFVFNVETAQPGCQCLPDRNCIDADQVRAASANWSTSVVSAMVLVALIASVELIYSAERRRALYHRLLLQCQRKCGVPDEMIKDL